MCRDMKWASLCWLLMLHVVAVVFCATTMHELPAETVTGRLFLGRNNSPYWVRGDIVVERNAELVIEQGAEVRFDPMVGITVRGKLVAEGLLGQPITLTSSTETPEPLQYGADIRLVDGPDPLSGRLQLFHRNRWVSVCSNTKNWTSSDMETACRQLGFQGGQFFNWYDRQMPLQPRLLYEEPSCTGVEKSVSECKWSSRQYGSGVCDYHPDLGIQCAPRHDTSLPHWRGIRFEYADSVQVRTNDNTMYKQKSKSILSNVKIKYAGMGRDRNTTSALEVLGTPPTMKDLKIVRSAFNGINITSPNSMFRISNCVISNNRGYGIFVNSSQGLVHVDQCVIKENGADGLKFVFQETRPDESPSKKTIGDFCLIPSTPDQIYPAQFFVKTFEHQVVTKRCSNYFTTQPGYVLTLYFIRSETSRNNTARFEVFDGTDGSEKYRLLGSYSVRNNTRPQTITSTINRIFIRFTGEPKTQMFTYMKIVASRYKAYDLNVSSTSIFDNNGRGIAVENLKSQVHVANVTISNNNHVAGLHVVNGVGDVNVTDSTIAFNVGDGINITYTGGNRNISHSQIRSNKGFGIAIWLNDTAETEYDFHNQTTVVQYSMLSGNLDAGILHGNYCGESYLNITGNSFTESLNTALEIMSCWFPSVNLTKLQLGHNTFYGDHKLSVKMQPAINIEGRIEYNYFRSGNLGAIAIKNEPLEEFNILKTNLLIINNYFLENKGLFVVSLGLSPYSDQQSLLFTRNFVKDNTIREPFETGDGSDSRLIPRSRVAAPIVISSNNVVVFRNIIDNRQSRYEIGSHLEDQSKIINCTYNWLGFSEESKIFPRIFHRNDRYNLAKIVYIPYILHSNFPLTPSIIDKSTYVHNFVTVGQNTIGGEIEGLEHLKPGEYIVERDINIRPTGQLNIDPGVTLYFPPSVGIFVAGRLEAKGNNPNNIKFTLKEPRVMTPESNSTEEAETEHYDSETEILEIEPKVPIRLLGGKTAMEGRLQLRLDNEWGTVCNYGWTIVDAALVCHQLGFVLNPDDWYLERNEIPGAGISEKIIVTNVRCNEYDNDITQCASDKLERFENSCTHDMDVGVRCYESSWAGVRFGVFAKRSFIQRITVEKAGLLDYSTNAFKPAFQIDFARIYLEGLRVSDNQYDGLGVLYSDIYSEDAVNTIKNSQFLRNKGSGISFKQLGMVIADSSIEDNWHAGIRHNPSLTALQQRELAGWFDLEDQEIDLEQKVVMRIPYYGEDIFLEPGETRYLVSQRVVNQDIHRKYQIKCPPEYVVGIQLLNPIHNRSTEVITIHDSQRINPKSDVWSVNRDLNVFPTTSSGYGILMLYQSGLNALGNMVIVLSTVRAPVQDVVNKIIKGPIPTLTLKKTNILRNKYGIRASFYNRYLDEQSNLFLRKANETMKLIGCTISHNRLEAVHFFSPFWDVYVSNISEVTFMMNQSVITDNGKGIYHFSRDMRNANNLFHYILADNTFERNNGGGFEVNLPYVWGYNENFTHSVFMSNNTWRRNRKFGFIIDGHFARFNMSNNVFQENLCDKGLISVRGMEKVMKIEKNTIENNVGKYMVQFSADSQSEILGDVHAVFRKNQIRNNENRQSSIRSGSLLQMDETPSCVICFSGIQKVRVWRNIFEGNRMDYQLVAGIKTARIHNYLEVQENWWGTKNVSEIGKLIFDFDDWNNYAVAKYQPFLLEDDEFASHSPFYEPKSTMDLYNLGGRLNSDLVLYRRDAPYIVTADITVMPSKTLTIKPGVVMEFAPNVGILVLGSLKARGLLGHEIIMRPLSRPMNEIQESLPGDRIRRQIEEMTASNSIRLCKGLGCTEQTDTPNEGFLEYFNKTTLQWIPICDPRFTERNAQVVCRELGFDYLNVFFSRDIRIEFHSNSLSRIWSWPEPLQCKGDEKRYDDCPIRLNGQLYGHWHTCRWDEKFVFINCGRRNMFFKKSYWGGVRFADGEFEQHFYEHRIHDHETHETLAIEGSTMEFVKIEGAGILHNEKSPAVQAIVKTPTLKYINVTQSASHGINYITPAETMTVLHSGVVDTLGTGINVLSLTGEGRESDESSFTPLKDLNIPYNLFSMVDICDTAKVIIIEERVLVYYKYDNHPVNCVKIFKSAYSVKPFGFRLLQFNLFNSTNHPGKADSIELYDGDIYNISSVLMTTIDVNTKTEKKMFRTIESSLSVKFFSNGASSNYGFIAEIVTLPISAIGFNRDVQHNITNCELVKNREGALLYVSAGEINPIVTFDRNRVVNNCEKLYGNFTTCRSTIDFDIQNTQTLYFRDNLVDSNRGGLSIKADSRGSSTSLKGWIHNNLFVNNTNLPTLFVEGRQSSPYQEVTIYRNYFTRNYVEYDNVVILRQVVSNFTHNYVKRNTGQHIFEVSGFNKVRLPIYQSTTHNGFYNNYALERDSRSTIIAATVGQHYVDNIFFDPDNDYEMITVNKSFTVKIWQTVIDARRNYWGYNTTLAVQSRIRDQSDDHSLVEVAYEPILMNNNTVLNGKCPPGWDLVGDTCYVYVGAPMTFWEARAFCAADNASVPYVMNDYEGLFSFIRRYQEWVPYLGHVWVQHIDMVDKCTAFEYDQIQVEDCDRKYAFLCEIDPVVQIDPLVWRGDTLVVAVLSTLGVLIILIALVAICWYTKSKHRQMQRLERRNSIRQSLHSLRSIGSTSGPFSELGYRRKPGQLSTRSTDTLTKNPDYKKMLSNGSIDSMEKSVFSSSLDDNQSYDIYEAHNPHPSGFPAYGAAAAYPKPMPRHQYATPATTSTAFDLAYRNEGYRDNSTIASQSNYQSRAESVQDNSPSEDAPIIHRDEMYTPSDYYTTDTLPLGGSFGKSDSTLDLKQELRSEASSHPSPLEVKRPPMSTFLQELKTRMPQQQQRQQQQQQKQQYDLMDLPTPPDPPRVSPSNGGYASPYQNGYVPDYNTNGLPDPYYKQQRPQSANLLETDIDKEVADDGETPKRMPKSRSKSEALLETNFDYFENDSEKQQFGHPINESSRSKSQPLETAM